jgi:ArsR family transcriptional regulator
MDDYEARAAILKAIAHPARLHIVDLLRRSPECVCHLSAALAKSQPYVSQQLAVLRNAGVIVDEREGANVFYRLADEAVLRQVEAACGPMPAGNGAAHQLLHGCSCPKCQSAHQPEA